MPNRLFNHHTDTENMNDGGVRTTEATRYTAVAVPNEADPSRYQCPARAALTLVDINRPDGCDMRLQLLLRRVRGPGRDHQHRADYAFDHQQ